MPVKIKDQIIERVSTYSCLGALIDEKLHWSDYINNINLKQTNDSILSRKWVRLG